MQKRIDLKLIFEKATDINFRNLFYPVIPAIDSTGKLAQIISALTQAVTVWFICQTKFESLTKWVSIPMTLAAIVLICAAIELGGRKGAQVCTRQLIWKKFENKWYWLLGIPILLVTMSLFWLSFDLSTKGVNKTFVNSVEVAKTFDDGYLVQRYDQNTNKINTKYDKQISTLTTAYTTNYNAREKEYDSKISAVQSQIAIHANNTANGVKWAKSHQDKQTGIKNNLVIDKQTALNNLTLSHNTKISTIEANMATELTKANEIHQTAVKDAKKAFNDNHRAEKDNADFWGSLFSNIVGIMIVVALVCIVIVEVFRKGAGIAINYEESELPPSLWGVFCVGLNNRLFNVFYELAKKWYVQKRAFSFVGIAPSTPIDDSNLVDQPDYFQRPKKYDYHNLFNIENTDFSKNYSIGENIVATVEMDDTSSEDEKDVQTLSLDDLSSEQKKVVISGQIVGEKNCLNCGNSFQYKNKKKVYCSTRCRQENWEKNNGKELKRGRVKKDK